MMLINWIICLWKGHQDEMVEDALVIWKHCQRCGRWKAI